MGDPVAACLFEFRGGTPASVLDLACGQRRVNTLVEHGLEPEWLAEPEPEGAWLERGWPRAPCPCTLSRAAAAFARR